MSPLKILAMLGLAILAQTVPVVRLDPSKRRKDKENCFIITVNSSAPQGTRQGIFDRMNGTEGVMWNSTVLRGFVKCNMRSSELEAYAKHPWVESIHEDMVVSANTDQSTGSSWWNLDRIDQRSRSGNGIFHYTYTGAGIYIYVVDTGVRYSHTEFGGRVLAGANFVNDGRAAYTDCNGHGTHVAATAAGQWSGAAKSAWIVPVRVLPCSGSGATSSIISGLNWISQYVRGVISMSLGTDAPYTPLDTAVYNMVNTYGHHVVVAAGNDNGDACSHSPARASGTLTVGATTSSDARASYSNYGSCVDLFAPGDNIYSASYSGDNLWTRMSGTSMATPLVSGEVAAILQGFPGTSPANMISYLKSTATSGYLSSIPSGTVNLLLYSYYTGARREEGQQTTEGLDAGHHEGLLPPPTEFPGLQTQDVDNHVMWVLGSIGLAGMAAVGVAMALRRRASVSIQAIGNLQQSSFQELEPVDPSASLTV